MCGIVGYTGSGEAGRVLLDGLKKLEYRGYDSSGLAILNEGEIGLARSVGKLGALEGLFAEAPLSGSTGIGHTRWATHGRPSEENAHPHLEGAVAVVHNGIIENYLELRKELIADGAAFKSETDTEILAHLINREISSGADLTRAVRAAVKRVRGSYALAAICLDEPSTVVGARMECPLIVGIGAEGMFLGSDVLALLDFTRDVVFLEDGDFVTVTKEGFEITDARGDRLKRATHTIDWTPAMAEKGGYRHFMLKEIFEQPKAITDTFRGLIMEETGDVFLDGFPIALDTVDRVYIVACGTSWHAALVGKFLIEELAGVSAEVDLASEFRYREPLLSEKSLVIAISQSGETADTLAAVGEARRRGAKVITICNVVESSLTREADYSMMTHAGPEIGVASTKAFTTQLTALYLFALYAGRRLGRISAERGVELVTDLLGLPKKVEKALEADAAIEKLSRRYFNFTDFLYLGRSINYPIALEGALKLKEISYIHAEGYPAGEMKHGPIALIDEELPSVVLAPTGGSYSKMCANMEEVKARGGRVIAVVTAADGEAALGADDSIEVPASSKYLTPIVLTIPLQLLAYHIAVLKGTDVDQPEKSRKERYGRVSRKNLKWPWWPMDR